MHPLILATEGKTELRRQQTQQSSSSKATPTLKVQKQELALFTGNRAKGYALIWKGGEFAIHSEDNKAQ